MNWAELVIWLQTANARQLRAMARALNVPNAPRRTVQLRTHLLAYADHHKPTGDPIPANAQMVVDTATPVGNVNSNYKVLTGILAAIAIVVLILFIWATREDRKKTSSTSPTTTVTTTSVTSIPPTTASTTPTTAAPSNQPGASASASASNTAVPADLETVPRYTMDMAPLNTWVHPVFDQAAFQRSGGTEGQWSWYHTMMLTKADGGRFKTFERNDGSFVFRMDRATANVGFSVLNVGKYRDQFMQGSKDFNSVNIRSMPGTTIHVVNPSTGAVLASQAVSQGGDLTVILPEDGVVSFLFTVNDPATTFEVKVWFGPYDRSKNINTLDARALLAK